MFYGATSFNQPLGAWNVGAVTSTSYMFAVASAFNQDLSTWNVSNVTNMSGMFYITSFNQPLNTWNVSHVTNFNSMFNGNVAYNQPLSNWNTSAATNMNFIFSGARSFNQDISSWDVSHVTAMGAMFANAAAFNQPLNSWHTNSSTNMSSMFDGAAAFNQDISSWDVSHVTTLASMFNAATSFNQDVSSWNVSGITSMDNMFYNATAFSSTNYGALLNAWSQQNVHPNVTLDANVTHYCDDAVFARTRLINVDSWHITDAGLCADVVPPVITLIGSASISINQGSSYADQGATATDTRDGNLTSHIVTTGSVNTAAPGTYTITYTATDAANNTGSATRSVRVIGGGAASVVVVPTANGSSVPLDFSIVSGPKVTSPLLALTLNANPSTVHGYAVSLDPAFKDASIIPLTPKDATFALPDKAGTYTLYLKYYSTTGQSSDVVSQTVTYAPTMGGAPSNAISKTDFFRPLKLGTSGTDVKALQVFLNTHGFTVAKSGAGSIGNETTTFGPATMKAVMQFQEANAAEILKPYGLKKGTGVLGPATMKVMNSL